MVIAGSLTALATPFAAADGALDEATMAALVARQIALGAEGLVVGSVVGEASTLTPSERVRVVRVVVEAAGGRVPVIAGVVANATDAAITGARAAEAAGASAALVTTPYYNKPGQEGLFRHFEAVARAVDLPLILADAPDRCMVGLAPHTVERLAAIPTLIGIEDASGDPVRTSRLAQAGQGRILSFCGQDARALDFHLAGGHGCISAAANIVPGLRAALHRACRAGAFEEARALQAAVRPLDAALTREPGPAAVKFALAQVCRLGTPSVRLPLLPVARGTADAITAALDDLRGAGLVEHASKSTLHAVPRMPCRSRAAFPAR